MLATLCRQAMLTMTSCVASGARTAAVWGPPAPAVLAKFLPSRCVVVTSPAAWVGGAAPLPRQTLVRRAYSATSWPAASQAADDIEEVDFEPGQANFLSLIGTTGKDVELKVLERGQVATVPLAVEFKKSKSADKETQWLNVEMYGPLAERAASTVKKGTRVLVEGRLKLTSWQDKATGAKRTGTSIVAASIKRVRRTGGGQAGAWGAEQQQQQAAWPGATQQQQQAAWPGATHQQQSWPGSVPAQQASPAPEGQAQTAEEVWMDLAQNPSDWVDYRAEKLQGTRSPKFPDFKRRADGQPLWITGRTTPAWVETEIAQGAFSSVPKS